MHSGGRRSWFRWRRSLRFILPAALVAAAIFALPRVTWAHPLGNFTINRYSRLELGPEEIRVHYVLDMAEIPAFQERARIDADQDGSISRSEREAYLASQVPALRRNLRLLVGGVPLQLETQSASLEFPPGQGGLTTLRLSAGFVAVLPAERAPWEGEYEDENYAGRLGWQEIVVRAGTGARVLESSAPAQDVSRELRSYPQDLLQSPLAISQARFRFGPGPASGGGAAQIAAAQPGWGPRRDPFVALIEVPVLGPGALLLALLAAFGWGATHALTPGHGKTVVAAYLVGSRGTVRHALFLGLTTTVTHTAGVFTLGVVTLFASRFIVPERLYPWLGIASGLLVVVIGASLFRTRLRHLLRRGNATRPHGHDHDHAHAHDHDHSHDHGHTHDHGHSHDRDYPSSRVTWRSLLALGISGGLLPCPSALVVMLGAIALQRVGLGLLLIVAFSLGLASVLTAIGVLLVHAGRLLERLPAPGRLVHGVPVASALLITVAGVGITLRALIAAGLW